MSILYLIIAPCRYLYLGVQFPTRRHLINYLLPLDRLLRINTIGVPRCYEPSMNYGKADFIF
jgi:hypothetical protein